MKFPFLNIFTKIGKTAPKTPLKKIIINAPTCQSVNPEMIRETLSKVNPDVVIFVPKGDSTAKLLGLLGVTSASATTAYATTKAFNEQKYSSTTA